MTIRNILFLVVALVVAGGTAFYARSWLAGNRIVVAEPAPTPAPAPKHEVLVAATALKAGQFVQDRDLKWIAWPKDGLSDEYAMRGKRTKEDFVGAVVRSEVAAGQPVTDGRIVHPGDRGFLAAVLTPGLRAVSVPVNPTTGIAGFVFPDDLVDVLLTVKFSAEDLEGKRHTRYFTETLLTGVRVLAIDQTIENMDGAAKPVKTVTLEVLPKHAEHVAIGLELGTLTLSLHSLAREPAAPEMPEAALAQLRLALEPPRGGQRGSSHTMDSDVFYMLGPGGKSEAKHQVNVLRGNKSD